MPSMLPSSSRPSARISRLGRKRYAASCAWYHAFECTPCSPAIRESLLRGKSKHHSILTLSTRRCALLDMRPGLAAMVQFVGRSK